MFRKLLIMLKTDATDANNFFFQKALFKKYQKQLMI